MNKASPVSTPHGSASGCSKTTTEIDSGVCPGVARISRTTSPSTRRCRRERLDRELGRAPSPKDDARPGGRRELEMTREEVGVEVRLDHPLDPEIVASASARYCDTSRCGSTTTARPVVSSPIR